MAKIGTMMSDSKKESDGVWLRYRDTDVKMRIARIGNPRFEAEQRRLKREAREQHDGGELSERQARDIIAPAVAEFIVLDWENLENEDGSKIPYSREKCVELLRNPELHDLYDWIVASASNRDNYAKSVARAAAKNSDASSTGS